VVVIAHRLTTTKHCDNIVLMDHGTVMEEAHRQGSVSAHAQLIANDGRFPLGLYAQLWAHWEAMDL
jgi:ABC-type multidrug transport system fused ATPase/permease subunit